MPSKTSESPSMFQHMLLLQPSPPPPLAISLPQPYLVCKDSFVTLKVLHRDRRGLWLGVFRGNGRLSGCGWIKFGFL